MADQDRRARRFEQIVGNSAALRAVLEQAKLKAERCPIPIIFITAHGDAKMRIHAMREGAVEFLSKPFDDAVLLEIVHAALKRSGND